MATEEDIDMSDNLSQIDLNNNREIAALRAEIKKLKELDKLNWLRVSGSIVAVAGTSTTATIRAVRAAAIDAAAKNTTLAEKSACTRRKRKT
ncbi:uncharacterized protein LOC112552332 isoform X2 [Pogonomyrmex barbatus]|uniref:Uncharacterized protein LOC112552332 isoform X2 n=1 Tax=Pogonomyrmex barbatus TaxID=144034 RepID=A0A8N1S550_9HYME|nr:uncharacterized protein LOC112552332 isoform X2 [Pogonomyrmex barbatus]